MLRSIIGLGANLSIPPARSAIHTPIDPAKMLDAVMDIVRETDLERILSVALESARRLTAAKYAAIGILDEERANLARFVTVGVDPKTERAIGDRPRGRGVLGLLITDPKPIRLDDIGSHPKSYGFPLHHPPMRTFLGVPLIRGDVAWGSFYLAEKDDGRPFTAQDEAHLLVLADATVRAAVTADEVHQLHGRLADLQVAAEAFRAGSEIARTLGGESDRARLIELIVKRARALVNARGVVLDLVVDGVIERVAVAGDLPGIAAGQRVSLADAPLVEGVFRSRSTRRIGRDDPGGSELEARLGANASLLIPLVLRNRVLGVLVCVDRLDGPAFTFQDADVLEAFGASAAAALGTAESAEVRGLQRAISASERERAHWARELHDGTLQELAAAKLLCGLILRTDEHGEREALIRQAMEQLDATAAELRSLVTELRPATLDALGLKSAVDVLIERLTTQHRVPVSLECDLAYESGRAAQRHTTEIEGVLYRVVQEALNNAIRHSGASHVDVRISEGDGEVEVVVSDDGCGFDPEASVEGFGILGMRERAELVAGTLTIESAPDEGSRVVLRVPALRRGEGV